MNIKDYPEIVILSVGILIGGVLTGFVLNNNKDLKQEAISLGYVEYNKTNGNWQWITNINK